MHEVAVDRVDEEGVLHRARRVIGVEVQRVEVEPLVLELGALARSPSPCRRRCRATCSCSRESGCRAPAPPARRQRGDVDALGLEPRGASSAASDLGLARGERLVDAAARLPDELAERGLLVGGRRRAARVELRERRRLAGVRGAGGLQRGGVGGGGDRGERGVDGGVDGLRIR